jgi:hypothetical protein
LIVFLYYILKDRFIFKVENEWIIMVAYYESGVNRRARMETEKKLGINIFAVQVVNRTFCGKNKREYSHPDSREREKIARRTYSQHIEDNEGLLRKDLVAYESRYGRVEKGEIILKMRKSPRQKTCKLCSRENIGAYEICPVCLDVYHNEFREKFLSGLDSCTALRVVDGV